MLRVPVLALLVLSFASQASSAAETTLGIFILIGDQHSAYERTAQFVARVDRLKAQNPGVPLVVLIDGDTFEQGNAVAKRSAGEIEFAVFAALARRAPTVLNLGNHEPEFYDPAQTAARVEATGVRVVSNLMDKSSGKLFARPSLRLELASVECEIAGVTTDQLAQYRAAIRPLLDVTDPVVWARDHFPKILEPNGVPIVLSHAGLRSDGAMFSLVPDGTLFVGAHDHLRFVTKIGRTVYVHSGSWNSHFSVARLGRDEKGFRWQVEQIAIESSDPSDPELAELIQRVEKKYLAVEDLVVLGRAKHDRTREEAARWVAHVVARAAGADAAFIGNTTFGAGLPAGDITRVMLDACVRFDGPICVARVSGAQLRTWIARANETADTPFAQRRGEFLFGDAPAKIDDAGEYLVATTDWGMKNRERYFGRADLSFAEHPELRLKAIVAEALKHEP